LAKRHNKGRDVSGIVLLDKPQGITSNQALQRVKRIFNANKAGHTGSLDPLATGMLPICLGEATKISGYLLSADKRYQARCQLGVRTDSADADGEVIARKPVSGISRTVIEAVLGKFKGPIQQIPPMHSALKRDGVPLYKLARKGIEVERQPRAVTIYSLTLDLFEEDCLALSVHCSKGTYIRTLVDDIGEMLGCGAHLTALRRLQVDPFNESELCTLEQLNTLQEQGVTALDNVLLPVKAGLADWPAVRLNEEEEHFLRLGQSVFSPKMLSKHPDQALVRLDGQSGSLVGIGIIDEEGRLAPKRLMNLT
jgi:tRNA pseudouridine55 synthase